MDRIFDLFASTHALFAQVGADAPAAAAPAAGGAATPGAGGPPPGCGGPEQLLFMVGMLVLFYFMLIRPQQKRAKQHKQMVDALKRGDAVITSSGIFGRITSVDGNALTIEIAKNTEIKILKSYVGGIANDQTATTLSQTPQQPNT